MVNQAKTKKVAVTVVGLNHYRGNVLKVGETVVLKAETNNIHDLEAVAVYTLAENAEKVGYIANSVETVIHGTRSSGAIYDDVKDRVQVFGDVLFVLKKLNSVIVEVRING